MNGFISQLVSRHTNPVENILPRLPGRFETQLPRDHFTREEIPAPDLNTPGETSISATNEKIKTQSFHQDSNTENSFPGKIMNSPEYSIARDLTRDSDEVTIFNETSFINSKSNPTDIPVIPSSGRNRINEDSNSDSSNTISDNELDPIFNPFSNTKEQKVIPDPDRIATPNTISSIIHLGPHQLTSETKIKPVEQSLNGFNNVKTITPRLQPIENGNNTLGTCVIKVSIGRIEVKAISPPNPVKAERTSVQKPKMTLEDYLKKRNSIH